MPESTVVRIEKPGPPLIVQQMVELVETAKDYAVIDIQSNTAALERIKTLRSAEAQIREYFEPSRKAADRVKREILATRDGFIGPIAEARALYDAAAVEYEEHEREIAERQRRDLEEQARKAEEEKQIQDAIEAEARGDAAEADAIMEEKPQAVAVSVEPQIAKVGGVTSRVTWSAEVHAFFKLVEYVAIHPEWLNLLLPNQVALNKMATAQQGSFQFPGVRAVSKRSRR